MVKFKCILAKDGKKFAKKITLLKEAAWNLQMMDSCIQMFLLLKKYNY
jgi:hypothetical protein